MYNENKCHTGKMNNGCRPRWGKFGGHHHGGFARHNERFFGADFRKVPVNIEETDEAFIVHLYAPTLIRENLKVTTKNDVLTISYNPTAEVDAGDRYSRREYSNGAFERAFALNGKCLYETISAKYTDGVLKVTLPKNPETNIPAKDIAVD